jgi:hypothetical protein
MRHFASTIDSKQMKAKLTEILQHLGTFPDRRASQRLPERLLQHPSEYAVEVELTRRQLGEIRPLPPEEAWRLARELDQRETRYPIEVEPRSALP